MRSHVTLLRGKVVSRTEYKPPCRDKDISSLYIHYPSPERGVDLQGFAQHLGSDVVHVVPAQVHLSQAGVAAQGIDQHGAPGA